MLLKRLAGVALVGLLLVGVGCATNDVAQAEADAPAVAQNKETVKDVAGEAKEVAFPKLPTGAGKIDEKAAKTFTTTESGLKYRILREGNGAKPTARQKVEVNYHGWLDNEKVFDSSYKRGESISFGLNQVIAGWTEGMQLVGKGGMIELEIPAKLGYGARGAGADVPPNATLHFLVELIDIK
jgi:FKBP-type peptidyl-prolyl cis-trans isomerase FkpA